MTISWPWGKPKPVATDCVAEAADRVIRASAENIRLSRAFIDEARRLREEQKRDAV